MDCKNCGLPLCDHEHDGKHCGEGLHPISWDWVIGFIMGLLVAVFAF